MESKRVSKVASDEVFWSQTWGGEVRQRGSGTEEGEGGKVGAWRGRSIDMDVVRRMSYA